MEKRRPIILEYLDDPHSGSSFWRGRGALVEMQKEYIVDFIPSSWNGTWATMRAADIAFFQRPTNQMCQQQVFMAKDMGLKIWVDLDDHFEIPVWHPVYEKHLELFDMKAFKKIMLLADVVTTTTDYLKDLYLEFSERVEVVPNAINDKWLQFRNPSGNKLVVWRGGGHKAADLYFYKEEIEQVMEENPDWHFIAIGDDAKFLKINNYQFVGDFSIHDYFGLILNMLPSVFISPLIDIPLNRGKSEINWLEATLCGACCVTPSYWGKTKHNSFQYNDKASFKEALSQSISNREKREKIIASAVKTIKKQFVMSVTNKQRMCIIESLLNG